MLKTSAYGLGFQHLPRDRANVNVLKNHRCYCIKSTKYLLKFGKNMALSLFGSQREEAHFLISVFLVREHQKIQDGGHYSIRPRCFGNDKLVAVQV